MRLSPLPLPRSPDRSIKRTSVPNRMNHVRDRLADRRTLRCSTANDLRRFHCPNEYGADRSATVRRSRIARIVKIKQRWRRIAERRWKTRSRREQRANSKSAARASRPTAISHRSKTSRATGERKKRKRQSPVGTRPGANRSLLSHRTPILIRTRSMQAGWMPASSPAGTTGRYDACNLFLLPPIFFLPLDQLLLISRRWCLRERRRKHSEPKAPRDVCRGYYPAVFIPEISP